MSGCAGESIRATSLTPAEFVGAVKHVSLHDDLADYTYTARALKLPLSQDPAQAVYDPASNELLGHATSIRPDPLPTQFSKLNFEYRTFYPKDEPVHRTRFVLTIDSRNLCVHREDVLALFGQPDTQDKNAHSDIDGFSYSSVDGVRIYFGFSLRQECLHFISAFQEYSGDRPGSAVAARNIETPKTVDEFFRNLSVALEDGSLLKPNFYTKPNLQQYFSATNVSGGVEHEDDGGVRLWTSISDFKRIFAPISREGASGPLVDAQIATVLTTGSIGHDDAIFNLVMQTDGPTLERIRTIFKGDFTLDKSIPHEPPLPQTGPHGNEGWWYLSVIGNLQVTGFFQFNRAGFLRSASFKMKMTNGK
jgi:hypothetical protein